MRTFSIAERRNRLAQRHFLSGAASSLDEVTRSLVGLHGTDPATPYLSLWARLPGFSVTDLDSALYRDRGLVKHMAMRRTLWVVHTADLPAVQAAASDRVAATERKRLIGDVEKSGIAADGEAWLELASAAVRGHLEAGLVAGTAALRGALPELAGSWESGARKDLGREYARCATGHDRAVRAGPGTARPQRRYVDDGAPAVGRGGALVT
ncbi:hypothetical protein MAUB1S_00274 [Mycolicibacterium aubagnense]